MAARTITTRTCSVHFGKHLYSKEASLFQGSILKNVPLSTFHGRPNDNVQDWLSEIEEYFDIGNVSAEQRHKGARLLLRDNARRCAKQYVQPQFVGTFGDLDMISH
ncbi:hypothetical protein BGX26_011416, partial [Mortierella sp. AD094]